MADAQCRAGGGRILLADSIGKLDWGTNLLSGKAFLIPFKTVHGRNGWRSGL